MSHQGASLQSYNNELVQCLEDLRNKRESLNNIIIEEEKKSEILKRLELLKDELSKIDDSLNNKLKERDNFDHTIEETEAAYNKILESSQTLLHVLKRETMNLSS